MTILPSCAHFKAFNVNSNAWFETWSRSSHSTTVITSAASFAGDGFLFRFVRGSVHVWSGKPSVEGVLSQNKALLCYNLSFCTTYLVDSLFRLSASTFYFFVHVLNLELRLKQKKYPFLQFGKPYLDSFGRITFRENTIWKFSCQWNCVLKMSPITCCLTSGAFLQLRIICSQMLSNFVRYFWTVVRCMSWVHTVGFP